MKKEYGRIGLIIVLIFLPLFWVLALLFCNHMKFDLSLLVPTEGDEVIWWGQISSMVKYGGPLGYYGYNGTHAAVGTFAAWGPAPLLPYAAFGTLFGWKLHSMALANIMFLCLSLLVFVILVKPTILQTCCLIVLYSCESITIGYSLMAMSEGLRYSLAIILVGLLIWTERHTKVVGKLNKKEIVGLCIAALFIFYAVLAHLIFALVLPIFCFYILRKLPTPQKVKNCLTEGYIWKVLICIAVTFLFAFIANKITRIIIAPGYSTSGRTTLWNQIAENGLYAGGCYFLNNFFKNLNTVNIMQLLSSAGVSFGIVTWFYINYLVVQFMLLYKMISSYKEKKFSQYSFEAAFLMAGFLVGYCALYTGSVWTLCRGINSALVMAYLYLCVMEEKDIKIFILSFALFGSVSSWWYYDELLNGRYDTAQQAVSFVEEQEKLEKVIHISPDNSKWNNTVAHYGTVNYMSLSLPVGCGINYMLFDVDNEDAKYVVITKDYDSLEERQEELLSNGHRVLLEDEYFVVLENTLTD